MTNDQYNPLPFSRQASSLRSTLEPRYLGYPPAPCPCPDMDGLYYEFAYLAPEHRKALEARGWSIVATRQNQQGQEIDRWGDVVEEVGS